jgi:outer membrane immunogenic protein
MPALQRLEASMRKLFFLALAGAILTSTPAHAEGPRIEVRTGWDRLDFDLGNLDRRSEGITYGGAIGFDKDLAGNLFAGIEGTVDFSSAELVASAANNTAYAPRRDFAFNVRLGTTIGANAKVFGKIGYANALFRDRTLLADGTLQNNSIYRDGIRLGIGAEVPITPRTYLKTEYNYTNYSGGVQRNQVLTGFGVHF